MMVQSPLELYTTFLGLKYYNIVWDILNQTGVVFLPFLALVIRGLTQPFETPFGNGADLAFRRTFIQFILMGLVCYFAAAPAFTLDVKTLSYQPACNSQALMSHVGKSGTTYDQIFQDQVMDEVKVPALLGLVLDVASGITYATIKSVPCTTDIQQVMHMVDLTRFSTPLRNEIQQFDRDCYVRAKSQFNLRQPEYGTYSHILATHGGDIDLDWMGSYVLQSLYYPTLRPRSPVKPFPYDEFPSPIVDYNVDNGEQADTPEYGYPTCDQWWKNDQYGLEKRIVAEVQKNFPSNAYSGEKPAEVMTNDYMAAIRATGGQTADDLIARSAIYHNIQMKDAHMDAGGGILSHLSNIGQTVSQFVGNFDGTPGEQAKAQDFLPIIQALLIFAVLVFYPIIMVTGNYSGKVMIGLFFLLFSLIFTSAIWHMLTAMQNSLNNSLSYFNWQNPEQKPILNNFFVTLYFLIPLFFNGLISGAGVQAGAALDKFLDKANGQGSGSSSGGSSGGGKQGGDKDDGDKKGPSGGGSGGSGGSGGAAAGETAAEGVAIAGAPLGI